MKRIWISLIGLLLAGCATATPVAIEHTATSILPTALPSIVPSTTPTVPPTVTLPVPTFTARPTLTASPTRPTPLPVARLELDVAKKKFDIFDQSSDCQLPCFNGLTPYVSAHWEAQDFFARLGFDRPDTPKDSYGRWLMASDGQEGFEIPYLIASNLHARPNLYVEWARGKVTTISFGFVPYREWIGIPRLLESVDETPEITLSQDVGGETLISSYFFINFQFPKHQLMVTYKTPGQRGTVEHEFVCISPSLPVDVYVTIGDFSSKTYVCPCDYAPGHDWSASLKMTPEKLLASVRYGDFCLPSNN